MEPNTDPTAHEVGYWIPASSEADCRLPLDEVTEQKIKTIIITHRDRFIRFGYDWFEKFCMKWDTTIVVVNNEELSPQEELVQDIVSILNAFSCRLYGLRKYKKQIMEDKEIAEELQNGNKSDTRTKGQD